MWPGSRRSEQSESSQIWKRDSAGAFKRKSCEHRCRDTSLRRNRGPEYNRSNGDGSRHPSFESDLSPYCILLGREPEKHNVRDKCRGSK
jgi:hypothetical protein